MVSRSSRRACWSGPAVTVAAASAAAGRQRQHSVLVGILGGDRDGGGAGGGGDGDGLVASGGAESHGVVAVVGHDVALHEELLVVDADRRREGRADGELVRVCVEVDGVDGAAGLHREDVDAHLVAHDHRREVAVVLRVHQRGAGDRHGRARAGDERAAWAVRRALEAEHVGRGPGAAQLPAALVVLVTEDERRRGVRPGADHNLGVRTGVHREQCAARARAAQALRRRARALDRQLRGIVRRRQDQLLAAAVCTATAAAKDGDVVALGRHHPPGPLPNRRGDVHVREHRTDLDRYWVLVSSYPPRNWAENQNRHIPHHQSRG